MMVLQPPPTPSPSPPAPDIERDTTTTVTITRSCPDCDAQFANDKVMGAKLCYEADGVVHCMACAHTNVRGVCIRT